MTHKNIFLLICSSQLIRDGMTYSLLMMSEEGNGNEVHNGKMTRSRMMENIYICVCMCVVDVSTCVYMSFFFYMLSRIESRVTQSSIVCSFSRFENLLIAAFISLDQKQIERTKSDQGDQSINLCTRCVARSFYNFTLLTTRKLRRTSEPFASVFLFFSFFVRLSDIFKSLRSLNPNENRASR